MKEVNDLRQTRFVERKSRIVKSNEAHQPATSRLLGGMLVALVLLVTAVAPSGQLFGDVRDKGTSRPFMLMHHGLEDKPPKPEQTDLMKEMTAMTKAWEGPLLD
jgi:hypothetical protein